MSRPSRARGLKLRDIEDTPPLYVSRPSRARGLKPAMASISCAGRFVAPLAGAWIETCAERRGKLRGLSRPSRARGLKQIIHAQMQPNAVVAPLAGAWIETRKISASSSAVRRRAPRGRVD